MKKLQTYGGFVKIHQLDRELCSIEGCQSYICAPLTFDAKVPLAQRELLFQKLGGRVTYLGFIKIHPLDRELCSIEGCQNYICVALTFDPNVPLAQRELLVEVPSLRVTLVS